MLDLTDRKNCFYWQTDRNLDPEDYKFFFLQRHKIPEQEILETLRNGITSIPIKSLKLVAVDENVIKGNVNIVRKVLVNGAEYIVRMHPKGVKNGYFYVERVILDEAKQHGLPVPQVLEIHEARDVEDMDLMLMTVAPGMTMDTFLSKDASDESELLGNAGKVMASIHDIRVDGFGFFNNKIAKDEAKLVGLHNSNKEFIFTALEENLDRLVTLSVSTQAEADQMKRIMEAYVFEPSNGSRLIHNDFADWNLLTDGKKITGILDWDESCGGDPILDLACWSTFFSMERFEKFLAGYRLVGSLPDDFDKRFHYYRLRYAISKMALRAKRFLVDKSDFIVDKIAVGKKALTEEVTWFSQEK